MAPMKRPAELGHHYYYRGTWSLGEAARRLAVSKKELRALLTGGQIDFVQIAGQIRIPIKVAQQYLEKSWWADVASVKNPPADC